MGAVQDAARGIHGGDLADHVRSHVKVMAVAGYGPIDRLRPFEVPLPSPGTREIRVRVTASALNPADFKVILGRMKFLHARNTPLVMGYDFSGTVDAVGPSVTEVSIGDDVFGCLPYGPGNRRGAFAEALIARSHEVARKPASVTHRVAAAAATSGLTGLQAIRTLGRLPPEGGRLLVTGVSGGVGSLAVGIGVRLGAQVTALGSGAGLDIAARMGASTLWDRTARDVPGDVTAAFDVVFDASAAYRWREWRHALRPGGAFVTTLPSLGYVLDKLRSVPDNTRVHLVAVKSRTDALQQLAVWLADGLEVPLDSVVPVSRVAEGLARLQSGAARGRIAVDVAGGF